MLNERSRRIADLFVEGAELDLGSDPDGTPILIWVNKLNSFDTEDARRDAVVARGLRIGELSKPEAPETVAIQAEMDVWTTDELHERRADQLVNEQYLQALDDVQELDADLYERVRRGPGLLEDVDEDEHSPTYVQLVDDQNKYLELITKAQKRLREESIEDMVEMGEARVRADYIKAWRESVAINEYLETQRMSQLYYALRTCDARRDQDGKFDHSVCNHNQRLLDERRDVRELPESVIERAGNLLDGLTVSLREAGNSDAPESSSASSEQPSAEEEGSSPSTPEETSSDAPTT